MAKKVLVPLLLLRRESNYNLCRTEFASLSQYGFPHRALAREFLREHLTRRGGKNGKEKRKEKQRGRRPEPRPSQRKARPGQGRRRGGRRKNRLGVKPRLVTMPVLDKVARITPRRTASSDYLRRVSLTPDSPKKNRRKTTKIENIKYTEIAHSVKRSPLPEMADWRRWAQAPNCRQSAHSKPWRATKLTLGIS